MKPSVMRLCVLALLSGCTSISYKPSLSLGPSLATIDRRVQIETFRDESPPGDRGKKVAGTSATEPGTLAGELSNEVTNAVLTDFHNNAVFKDVRRRLDAPDLVMRGTIRRFYAHAGPTPLMWATIPIDIIWFFGLPVQGDKGEVDLYVSLHRPDQSLVAEYHGRSEFSKWYTIYSNPVLGIGTRLNKAFDDAVDQIRRQMIADQAKLMAATQAAVPIAEARDME